MKIAECAHPSRYFSARISAKIPTIFFYWLPAADVGIQYCQTGYKARYKAKVCHLKWHQDSLEC